MAACAVAEEEALLVAHAHHSPALHGGDGKGHLVGAHAAVVGVVAVEFTRAVAFTGGLVLDGKPVRAAAVEPLVPIEAVVSAERNERVVDGDGATKEFDAVVKVGHHFHVVDGGAGSDACKGQAVDFVGRTELGAAVANADVSQHTGVVFVVLSAVLSLVVVGGDAFHLGHGAKVGGGVSEDDQTSPLAARVVRHRAVEGVPLEGEHDGAVGGAFGEDLASLGDNHGGGVHARA